MPALTSWLPQRNPVRKAAALPIGPAAQLRAALESRRRKWRAFALVEATLFGVLLAVALAGAGAVLVVVLAASGTALGWTLGCAAGAGACCGLGLGIARWRSSLHLGRWVAEQAAVEMADPATAEALRSGLELAMRAAFEAAPSVRLLDHALAHALRHLGIVDAARASLRGRLLQYTGLLAVATCAWAVSTVATPQFWDRLLRARQDTGPAVIEFGTLVGDVHAHVAAPPHAAHRLAPREEEATDLAVLHGSRVTMRAAVLPGFGVTHVEIETHVATGFRTEVSKVVERADHSVQWARIVLEPLRYRYAGRDNEGNRARERGWRDIKTWPDQPPTATLRAADTEVEVRPGQAYPIEGEARDDIGLALLNLVIVRPSSGVERRAIVLAALGETRVAVREVLAVDALQLRPGETATVYLEAGDSNPNETGRRGVSQKLQVRMFSADRHHARIVEGLARLSETWTLRLADRLERDPAARTATLEWALRNRGELADAEQGALEDLRGVQRELAGDEQAGVRTGADLAEIERRLAEPLASEARLLARTDTGATGYAAVKDLYAVQRLHAEVIAAEERAVDALARLASTEQQVALARDAQTLDDAEQRLLATLGKLVDDSAAPLRSEAERLLDAVEAQLDRLAAAASKQMRIVPYEHVNAGGLDAGGLQRDLGDHRQSLGAVRDLLRQGRTREAIERMRQLREDLQAVVAAVRESVHGKLGAQEAAHVRLVTDLRRGIRQVQQGQGRLRDELRAASAEQSRSLVELLRQARTQVLPAVQELLDQARDAVRPTRLQTAGPSSLRAVNGLRAAIASAQSALAGGHIDGALQAMLEADDLIGAAGRALHATGAPSARSTELDRARLAEAGERLAKAAAALRGALPRPEDLLRAPTRQRLEANALQQEQVRRDLDTLRQRLAAAGTAPALQHAVGARLDHALGVMREARDALDRFEATRAFEQGGEVLESLQRAADMLSPQGGAEPSASDPIDVVGLAPDRGAADVGSGAADAGVEAFRADVLRAMQRRAPGAWSDRLQRYYKAIVR